MCYVASGMFPQKRNFSETLNHLDHLDTLRSPTMRISPFLVTTLPSNQETRVYFQGCKYLHVVVTSSFNTTSS